MKRTCLAVIAGALLLAGCGSTADDRPTAASSSVASTQPSPTPTATTTNASTDRVICSSLVTVADPATQLTTLLGVTENVRLAPNVSAADLTNQIAALTQYAGLASPDLAAPITNLLQMLTAVKEAVDYRTTVDPAVSYSAATEDQRQIKTVCGRIGVVGP